MHNRVILLIITGGIAAYKALELIRLLKKAGARVVPVLSRGGAQFVTPLSVSALAEEKVYSDLFSLTDEMEMGHIRLSRLADLVVVAPASADIIAKMAHGMADDLASTLLLASNRPVMIAPAMNPMMWQHPATQSNVIALKSRGIRVIDPTHGDTACGEEGQGRMAEAADIYAAITGVFEQKGALSGKRALVTAGPTYEPIDPVRFIGNRSSGLQGYAVASALAHLGADVALISGPTTLDAPKGINTIRVTTAAEMHDAVMAALPVDIAICAAAVADWRVEQKATQKIKKDNLPPTLALAENPDILHALATHKTQRPKLVVGFAAETDELDKNAAAKISRKQCDWLLANNVAGDVFGGSENEILFLTRSGENERWPRMSKDDVARMLTDKVVQHITKI